MDPQHPAFDATEQDILSKIVPDGADDGGEGAGEGGELPAAAPVAAAPAPAAEAPAAAPAAPAAAPAPAAPATSPVAALAADGVAAGPAAPAEAPKHGEPRAALRASRRAEARLRDENAALREENERLKKHAPPPADAVTDEELAELEDVSPVLAKVARAHRELEKKVAPAPAPAAAAEFEAPSYAPEVQELIDGVPDLVAWQYDPASQDRFARAIQYDQALAVDPDWKDKPLAARFEEAARRTRAVFEPSAASAPTAAPAAARPTAADMIAAAPTEGPKGISDFRGGGTADAPARDYSRMTDEQIMASLPVS